MKQLTEEQIKLASNAFEKAFNGDGRSLPYQMATAVRAAAQFLQLPWEEPTLAEIKSIRESDPAGTRDAIYLLNAFVRSRNLALLPKAVDPRREKIIAAISPCLFSRQKEDELINRILAALDEEK